LLPSGKSLVKIFPVRWIIAHPATVSPK
jgi:hypothetical protein